MDCIFTDSQKHKISSFRKTVYGKPNDKKLNKTKIKVLNGKQTRYSKR